MPKYINSDTFTKICAHKINQFETTSLPLEEVAIKIGQAIRETPAADVVEVVRCMGCGYFHQDESGGYCDRPFESMVQRLPDDFCSQGVKK